MLGHWVREGIRYRKWESEDGKRANWRIVLPADMRNDVLQELHSAPTASHLGMNKTFSKVRLDGIHETTKETPNMMMFGREVTLPEERKKQGLSQMVQLRKTRKQTSKKHTGELLQQPLKKCLIFLQLI